jgi:DnaJ-domain-containing protein 1
VSETEGLREQITQLYHNLQAAHEREAAVRDVIQAMARSTFDLQVVLQTVIDRAVRLCHADHGNIARSDGDVFRVAAFTSFSSEY